MPGYHTRTLKLKLSVNEDSPEVKTAIWKRLYEIQGAVWRAANWIATGQLINDQIVRRIYARKGINPKEDKEAVALVEEEFNQFFGTKRQATTERDIKERFPTLPPCVTNPLNQVVVSSYNKEKSDMLLGNRSLRTYKKTMPFTITKASLRFGSSEKGHSVLWALGRNESINFNIYYGKDKANFRLVVQRILDRANDYSASQIKIDTKDIYLLLVVQEPNKDIELNRKLCVGVDLGVSVPVYAALSNGPQRMEIGNGEDFIKVRIQMQSRRRRLQRNLVSVKGGKGRSKKLKTLENIGQKESNFARQYNHMISKKIIDFALKNQAGRINIEFLEGFKKDEPDDFILRNWSYFELQTMLADKAKRVGIEVNKVDPYHTSQTCSICGHYEEGQRDGRIFQCKNPECGEKLHADYNAARNIAKSTMYVTKKEQCEYHKKIRLGSQPKVEGVPNTTRQPKHIL